MSEGIGRGSLRRGAQKTLDQVIIQHATFRTGHSTSTRHEAAEGSGSLHLYFLVLGRAKTAPHELSRCVHHALLATNTLHTSRAARSSSLSFYHQRGCQTRTAALTLGRVDRLGQSILELLRRSLLDRLRDLGRASGVRDVSLVFVRVGVVDLPSASTPMATSPRLTESGRARSTLSGAFRWTAPGTLDCPTGSTA